MPYEPNYFGLKLGEAISAGAGHIASGLEKRYALQREKEERDRQMKLQMAAQGVEYDPANPDIAISEFVKVGKANKDLEARKRESEIQLYSGMGGEPQIRTTPAGVEYTQVPTKTGARTTVLGRPTPPVSPLTELKMQEIQEKKEAEKTKIGTAKSSQLRAISETMNIINEVDKLSKKFFATGWSNLIFSKMPKTDAKALNNYLITIKSNVGFDRLTKMRNESKTGGALGNVSDREIELLTASSAPLDPTDKNFEKNLEFIKDHYKRFAASIKDYSGYDKKSIINELQKNGFALEEAVSLADDYIKTSPAVTSNTVAKPMPELSDEELYNQYTSSGMSEEEAALKVAER